jgi:hypothetical protein
MRNILRFCRENLVEVIGIGIGRYPAGVFSVFPKCVWSWNPRFLITAISGLFGNEIPQTGQHIDLFAPVAANTNILQRLFERIICDWKDICCYKDLFKELRDKTLFSESIANFQFEDGGLDEADAVNPAFRAEKAMYTRGAFAGQKILVCCFWSRVIACWDESEFVDPQFLTSHYPGTDYCVQDVLNHYGITLDVVQNYKDGILKLQTGQYYAVWVICGAGTGKLPDGGNPYLVDQFLLCVDTFWKGGGAIVWWCDNDPLTFECNEWLKIAEFPANGSFPGGKIGLQLVKGCEGKQTLRRGDIKYVKRQVFNSEEDMNFRFYHRHTLAHNLASIYEGTTVSQANDASELGPFIPFSYDSEGGISSMMFLSDFEQIRGDVIIDCGFTKLFTELTTDGTLRYVQNIAALTIQCEKHLRHLGERGPRIYRPPSFTQNIDERVKARRFRLVRASGPFDVLYLIDATGSMRDTIWCAKDQCVEISQELDESLPQFQFQFGAIFYRDPVANRLDRHQVFLLTSDIFVLQRQISRVYAMGGGGDGPEDWVGAYRLALNNMNWRNGQRLIIHLADAPGHGRRYCGRNNYERESPKLERLIRRCATEGIKIVGMPIGDFPELSYAQCKAIYKSANGPMYKLRSFSSSAVSSLFKEAIVGAVISAAPKGK